MAFGKVDRLRRPDDFRICYRKGRLYKNRVVVIHVLPNDDTKTYIGYSVSTRFGNAVQRNRMRRRLRAIVEESGLEFVAGYNVVIAGRIRAKHLPFSQIKRGVHALLHKAGLLKK